MMAGIVLFVGCSDDGGESAPTTKLTDPTAEETAAPTTDEVTETTDTTAPETTAPESTLPPAVVSVAQDPGIGTDFEGALADTSVTACAADDNGWTITGTVTNPLDVAADYRIYVSFLAADGATRGLLQVDAAGVPPAAGADWAGSLGIDGESLRCVLRVERTRLG